MARPGPTFAFLLLVAGLPACADVDDAVDAGKPDAADVAPDTDPTGLPCSAKQIFELSPEPADVLVLLDRSASMATAFGSGTRYQKVSTVLADVVADYAPYVRFGYQELPGRQGCNGDLLCCASPPTVPIAANNAPAMLAAIAAADPVDGSTPTAAALQAAAAYYAGLDDGIANRYIVLATDGGPDCTLAGGLSSDAACAEALAQVKGLVSLGVRVLVLGVGPDFADDTSGTAQCLDALARAGGAAASPGSPGYYAASDPEALELAIEHIFGGVSRPSCVLSFGSPVTDTYNVALYLDGQQIPRTSRNGWQLDTSVSPPRAVVIGAYCDAIQAFQVKTIEVRFGCPTTCIDIAGCQTGPDAAPDGPPSVVP